VPCRRFRVTGKVQGVGYRSFVVRNGEQLDLAGTVRNADDGSVEIVANGREADLDAFRSRLLSGPRFATVTNVDMSSILDETVPLSGFRVIG
jgi:acylphosphatase